MQARATDLFPDQEERSLTRAESSRIVARPMPPSASQQHVCVGAALSASRRAGDNADSSEEVHHMLKGKRVQSVAALAAVVSLVIAGASTASNKAAPKPSSLSGEFTFVSHSGTQLAMDTIIKNFHVAYPNIKVEASYLPPGLTFSQPLLARINAGNAPDVLFTNPGPGGDVSAYQLGKAGKLLDLSKQPFAKRIPRDQRGLFYVGKQVYAEPVFETASGIVYNTTLFKKYGLKVPTTFAQLIQACGKAKAAGVSLLALPGLVGNEVMQSMAATFVYGSDPNWNTKRAKNQVTFASSPGWNRLLQRLAQLRDANCFPSGWQGANTSTTSQQLISGQALAY